MMTSKEQTRDIKRDMHQQQGGQSSGHSPQQNQSQGNTTQQNSTIPESSPSSPNYRGARKGPRQRPSNPDKD